MILSKKMKKPYTGDFPNEVDIWFILFCFILLECYLFFAYGSVSIVEGKSTRCGLLWELF